MRSVGSLGARFLAVNLVGARKYSSIGSLDSGARLPTIDVKHNTSVSINNFDITGIVSKVEDAGKHTVYITKYNENENVYYVKSLPDSAEYHERARTARERGQSIEGIYPDQEKQRFLAEKEVFSTRLLYMLVGNHTREDIFVVRDAKGDYYIAGKDVGSSYRNLRDAEFFLGPQQETRIKFPDLPDFAVTGRILLKIALYCLGENDSNIQNIGVLTKGLEPRRFISIDQEHSFEHSVGNSESAIQEEVEHLVNGPVYSTFSKLQLGHLGIRRREEVRRDVVHKIAEFLREETEIKKLFFEIFSRDYGDLYKEQIRKFANHLETMKKIFTRADDILQERVKQNTEQHGKTEQPGKYVQNLFKQDRNNEEYKAR